jgi:hypothetical protein
MMTRQRLEGLAESATDAKAVVRERVRDVPSATRRATGLVNVMTGCSIN